MTTVHLKNSTAGETPVDANPTPDERIVVTRQFVLAVADAARTLRREAAELEKNEEYALNNGVGRALRYAVESGRQNADMLAEWCKRHCGAAGLNTEDLPNV